MFLEAELSRPIYHQKNFEERCQSLNGNSKVNSNQFQTKFVKTNQKNNIPKGFGHSKMTNNNFSRRNSVATTDSSASSNQNAPEKKNINKLYNRIHSQQSWSTPRSKSKKRNNDFTEQRYNYEQMSQQQLQNQQLWPYTSEHAIQCRVSNSRISTCSLERNHQDTKTTKFCHAIYSEFVALSEFRLENRNDCFSDRHHRLLDMLSETPSNHITKTSRKSTTPLQMPFYELDGYLVDVDDDDNNISRSLEPSFSSLSFTSVSPMPYAWRQRILRDQLAKDSAHRKSLTLRSDESVALSHFAKY